MRKVLNFLVFFLCIFFAMTGAQASKAESDLRLWVVTDVHHLSPSLYVEGPRIQKLQDTGAGLEIFYSNERLEALAYQIEQAEQQPNALLVAGDLTLNGEYQSLVELQKVFAKIEALGTEVFVIPGNHDINNGWASSFTDSRAVRDKQITPIEFQKLMNPFGYEEATYQDDVSLSYITQLMSDHWLVMLDSNIYHGEGNDQPPVSKGELRDETLIWLEDKLGTITGADVEVTVVLHHSSIPHFELMGQNFVVGNHDRLKNILEKYQIPVTLSGHMHAQHIAQEGQVTDIATGAFAVQPSVIGEVVIDNNQKSYQQIKLDMDAWAKETKTEDPNLLDYDTYLKQVFTKANEKLDSNKDQNDELRQLTQELNLAFFAGNISNIWEATVSAYEDTFEKLISPDTESMNRYLQVLIDQANYNHQEFTW